MKIIIDDAYGYTCSKCEKKFETKHQIDTDKPLCNQCFKVLVDYTHDNKKSVTDKVNFYDNYLK